MMSESQINERIKQLSDEINILKSVVDNNKIEEVYNKIKETSIEGIEKINLELKESSREDKLKFIRAYRNLPSIELVKLLNEKFGTNYTLSNGSNYYKLTRDAFKNDKLTPKSNVKSSFIPHKDKAKQYEKFVGLLNQNLSQAEIGRRIGVSQVTVNSWIKKIKNQNPNFETASVANKKEQIKKMFELLKQGLTHREIAERLKVTEETISNCKRRYNPETIDSIKIRTENKDSNKGKYGSRDDVIKYLKIYYLGTRKEQDDLIIKMGLSRASFGTYIKKLIVKMNITPKEVGLTKFPINVHEYKNIEYLRL